MRDYWIPATKREVVEWLHAYYGGRYSRSFFRAKGRGECYAIFFKLRQTGHHDRTCGGQSVGLQS